MDTVLSFFLQGAAIGVAAALSPGPFQSLVFAQTLLGGWRRAAPIPFAPLVADIPIAITLVFIISQVPDSFLRFIHFAGAALLIYLAYSLWREIQHTSRTSTRSKEIPHLPLWKAFFQGVLMIFLSPGSYLFWALVNGPILLSALNISITHALAFLLAFYLFSTFGLLLIAYVLGRIGQINASARRVMQIASLALMVVIAAVLVQTALVA